MKSPERFRVPPLEERTRLDHYMVDRGHAPTRSQAKVEIEAGRVRVDGAVRKSGYPLRGGEEMEIEPPPEWQPPAGEDIPVSVLYENEEFVAIDKPAGLVVHPAPGVPAGTLVNALLGRALVSDRSGGSPNRPGIVHRLDKETSGVLIVARTARAYRALSRAFHDRRVEKVYRAIVLGTPHPDEGEIRWSVGRHPRERKKMSIHSRAGRPALSRYRVIESFSRVSLVEVRPETGRTHQIRVHLAAKGHPVLGDSVYGARRGRALPPDGPAAQFPRQALHALRLVVPHPLSAQPVSLEAPIPEDFRMLLEALRAS